jgi:peptidyl-tRNA hydrolase, PTH1 family
MSYLIVGLGNPGEEYAGTRHNTGRIIVESLAKNFGAELKGDKKLNSLVGGGEIGKEKATFVLPDTFMNNSGKAVAPKVKSVKQAKELIVVHDDLDLPLGTFKISWNRGAGGHRGVDSIIKAIKTQEFIRFRVGISPETAAGKLKKPLGEEAVNKCIIGKFKPSELLAIKKVVKTAAEAVETILSDSKSGLARAMTQFNK